MTSTTSAFIPFSLLLADLGLWSSEIGEMGDDPILDEIGVRDTGVVTTSSGTVAKFTLVLDREFTIPLFGLADCALVLGGAQAGQTELSIEIDLGAMSMIRFVNVTAALRFPETVLKPVHLIDGIFKVDPVRTHSEIVFTTTVEIGNHAVQLIGAPVLELGASMVGDSGVVVEASGIELYLDGATNPPGQQAGWRGVHLSSVKLYLPQELATMVGNLSLTDAYLGHGGFSGSVASKWNPSLSAKVGGMSVEIALAEIAFEQNALVASEIGGSIILPFFDEPVGVSIGIGLDGSLAVAVASPDGLYEFTKPGLMSVQLDALELKWDQDVFQVVLSGKLQPLVGGLDWPSFVVTELSIDSEGHVRLEGGWLDLPSQYALDFHGFKFEITRLGFGKSDDDGKWVGFSGGLKLVEGMPAGASVEGLRVTWFDDGRAPRISFDGVGVEFEVPDVLRFKGEVAYRELPGDVRRFDGAIELDLMCLDLSIDGRLVVGTAAGYTFFAIYVDAELPAGIPLFATGLGLYGFAGLFALNMEPDKKPEEQWYSIDQANSWYHRGTPGVSDLNQKWKNQAGSLALGAGVTLGTVSDNGFTFSGKVLLAIVFPGPILMLEGAANLLKERAKLGTEEPMFRALAVLDGRAGSFTFGLDARYRYGSDGEMIDVRGGTEAFFSLADASAWHLYIGRKDPTEQRIRADIFKLFEANAYFELSARQLAMGAWIGFAESWSFGPASLVIEAWIEGNAAVSFKPSHYSADLWLHGKVEAAAFGVSLGLSVDARLKAEAFTPFVIEGEFDVSVSVPVLPDMEIRTRLQWGPEPAVPPLPLPLKEVAVEHFKATASWPLRSDGDDPLLIPRYDDPEAEGFLGVLDQTELDRLAANQAMAGPPANLPVIPLDGRPHITFGRAVNDPAQVGNKAQVQIEPEWEQIGDPSTGRGPAVVKYSLLGVALYKRTEGQAKSWTVVAQTPTVDGLRLWGSWAPVPILPEQRPSEPGQTKLWLWSKNPFDYARRTGGAWDEWFMGRFTGGFENRNYPCPPPLADRGFDAWFGGLTPGWHADYEIDDHIHGQTFIDGKHRALGLNAHPGGEVALHSSPEGSWHTLVRRGLGDTFVLGVKPGLKETDEPCRTVRIEVSGGDSMRGRACVGFANRAPGPLSGSIPEVYIELPFNFAAQAGGGQPISPLEIIAVFVNELEIVGLNCGPRLDINSAHPLGIVELTLTCLAGETVHIDAFNHDGGQVVSLDLQGPFASKRVTVTGNSMTRIEMRGTRGKVILEEVCGTAEYSLHATAIGDKHYGPFPVNGDVVEVTGTNLDLIELHSVSPYNVRHISVVCGPNLVEAARREDSIHHTTEELARWSQPDFALEPHRTYRLTVETRAEVKTQPDAAQTLGTYSMTQFAYFRTEGPPGLADLSLPSGATNPEEITLRDSQGRLVGNRGTLSARPVFKNVLNDLAPYVEQTLPATVSAPGEKPLLPRPVYRAYDIGIFFNENSYVEAMYRHEQRDLALYLFTASNEPVRNTAGSPIVAADEWSQAEALALNASDERWVSTVNASGCVSLDKSTILRSASLISGAVEQVLGPDSLHEARLVPLLLHEDFSHGLDGWKVRDEGSEGGPSEWRTEISGAPPAPYLRQVSSIHGGSSDPLDPVKPGSVLLRADDPRLPANHPDQPGSWADFRLTVYLRVHTAGAVGVAFRDRGPGDTVRFSMSPAQWMLVRIAGGVHSVLASADHALQLDRDYRVTVEALGPSLRVHIDGSPLVAASYSAPSGAPAHTGRIGLYCWNDPNARFTDLRVDDFRVNAPVLYRFGFVTSQFANFFHQLQSFQDEVWGLRVAVPDQGALLALLAHSVALPSDDPTTRRGPSESETRTFRALAAAISNSGQDDATRSWVGGGAAIPGLEVTRVEAANGADLGPVGFLVRSPEPIDWRRVTLEVWRAPSWDRPVVPPRDVKMTDTAFGASETNQESVTLLLRLASNLEGVVLERLEWKSLVDPTSLSDSGWMFVDDGDQGSPSVWAVGDHGELLQTSSIHGSEPDDLGTCALAGNHTWTDFRLRTSLRSDAGALGVVFRYRDSGNYYRFSIKRPVDGAPGGAYRRLIKRQDGQMHVLWEDAVEYLPGQLSVLDLQGDGESLIGHLNGVYLFAVNDDTHGSGQLGLYCSGNTSARFTITAATREWTVHHAFATEQPPLPAGTRVRVYSGNASDPHDDEPGIVRRFIATGNERSMIRPPAQPVILRLKGPSSEPGHERRFLPDDAYTPVEMRVLRNADGTLFFLGAPDGARLEPGDYRLLWTYFRDNRALVPEAPVLKQAGVTAPERVNLDLPWRTR